MSVVVPLRDEERTLEALVDALLAQTRRPEEVVLVDAGSRDNTLAHLRTIDWKGIPARIIPLGPAYPGQARNAGVRAARYERIAFVDGGTRPEAEWLKCLCSTMERAPGTEVVYGSFHPIVESRLQEWAALAYIPGWNRSAGVRFRGPTVASILLRRSAWEAAGGFPPYRAGEDLIFLESLDRLRVRFAVAPDAAVWWQIPRTWRQLFGRFSLYSRHNLIAGRGWHWQYGAMRNTLTGGVLLVLGFVWSGWFHAALVAAVVIRTLRTASRKRDAFTFGTPFTPWRLIGVTAVLLLLDVATLWGTAQWLFQDRWWRRGESGFAKGGGAVSSGAGRTADRRQDR